MKLNREWRFFLMVLFIYYLEYITGVYMDEIEFGRTPFIDLVFVLFQGTMFFIINFILIERLFYKRRYWLFLASLLGLVTIYGLIEEGFLEPWLTPESRGRDPVTMRSILMFWGEMLVPLLAFIAVKFMNDNFEKEQRLQEVSKNNLSNELKLLKSQTQPHVLFNSLNNLYNFTLSKSDKAPELVLKLSNVLRYITYETAVEKVPLSKELAFIEDYIDLQKMQYEGRGNIEFFIKNEGNIEALKIAPFILIPFIENSFKHSFGSKIDKVFVRIKVEINPSELLLFVDNNFVRQNPPNQQLTIGGIGLKNVRQRLDLLYQKQYNLKIEEEEGFYKVVLKLSLTKT